MKGGLIGKKRVDLLAQKDNQILIIKGQRIVVGDVDVTLPDNEVFNAEVKSTYPSKDGAYGKEEYRVKHYINYEKLTGIPVVLVIEKTRNFKNGKLIPVEERKWLWKSFRELLKYPYKTSPGLTWIDAPQKKILPICHFKEEWFNDMRKDWWE